MQSHINQLETELMLRAGLLTLAPSPLFCFVFLITSSYLIYCGKIYSEKNKHKWRRVMWILTYGCCFSNLQCLGFFHSQAVNVLQWMLTCSNVVPDLGSGSRVWVGLVLLLTKRWEFMSQLLLWKMQSVAKPTFGVDCENSMRYCLFKVFVIVLMYIVSSPQMLNTIIFTLILNVIKENERFIFPNQNTEKSGTRRNSVLEKMLLSAPVILLISLVSSW